jgi:hypothetical protein
MQNKHVTSRLKAFKAKVREEAAKAIHNLDQDDQRLFERSIFEQNWVKLRRSAPLWNEIANGY